MKAAKTEGTKALRHGRTGLVQGLKGKPLSVAEYKGQGKAGEDEVEKIGRAL